MDGRDQALSLAVYLGLCLCFIAYVIFAFSAPIVARRTPPQSVTFGEVGGETTTFPGMVSEIIVIARIVLVALAVRGSCSVTIVLLRVPQMLCPSKPPLMVDPDPIIRFQMCGLRPEGSTVDYCQGWHKSDGLFKHYSTGTNCPALPYYMAG